MRVGDRLLPEPPRQLQTYTPRASQIPFLRTQIRNLEREIADATETDDAGRIEQVISALHEVQLEVARMENQEAIIDGFGVMSGRVKGAATGHG